MKRLTYVLVICMLGLYLAGCHEDKQKKYSDQIENNLQGIETSLDHTVRAKANLETNLNRLKETTDNLREEVNSLSTSIDQMNASLNDLQNQINTLRSAQTDFTKKSQGSSVLRWIIFIAIILVVAYLVIKFLKPPKPFDEEEEEDFSAFDEELGYEEPGEDLGGDEGESEPKSGN